MFKMNEVTKEKMKSLGQAVGLAIYFFTMLFAFIITIVAISTTCMENTFTLLVIVSMVVLFLGLVFMFYLLLRH